MISNTAGDSCKLAGTQEGTWIYILCQSEIWKEFYFDLLIGAGEPVICPMLDVIIVKDKSIFYKRELLVCSFETNKFKVTKVFQLKKKTQVCKLMSK